MEMNAISLQTQMGSSDVEIYLLNNIEWCPNTVSLRSEKEKKWVFKEIKYIWL